MTRILLIDDHEPVRRGLKALLESADKSFVVCAEAADGREAVLKAIETKPDVAILDLALPIMNGMQAAREISKLVPEVVMFMYTLYGSRQLEIEAQRTGIRHIVAKPNASELVLLLREAAQAKTLRDQPHKSAF